MTETPGVLRNDVPIWQFRDRAYDYYHYYHFALHWAFLDIYCGSELIAQESFP